MNALKRPDPFLPFGTLAADVKHTVGELAEVEGCFANAPGAEASSEDVLVSWDVVRVEEACQIGAEAGEVR